MFNAPDDLLGDVVAQLKELLELFELKLLAYARGPDGSLLVGDDDVIDTSGGRRGRSNCGGLGRRWRLVYGSAVHGPTKMLVAEQGEFVCKPGGRVRLFKKGGNPDPARTCGGVLSKETAD